MLSIEIWDTGIGIPDKELQAIFEEYHQLDNAARERSRGLGLGLSIVQRLGNLLGHRVSVRSQPGKGSVFAIEVALPPSLAAPPLRAPASLGQLIEPGGVRRTGTILVIEDDPEVRELLDTPSEGRGPPHGNGAGRRSGTRNWWRTVTCSPISFSPTTICQTV